MNLQQPFGSHWSAQTPFMANMTLQQIRLLISNHPWFKGHNVDAWFELPDETLSELQSEYQQEWISLGQQMFTLQPFSFSDRRFASDKWNDPLFGSMAAYYLLNSDFLLRLVNAMPIESEKPRQRLLYLMEQAIAASAPSNFLASNPDALSRMFETQGASLYTGMLHLASDMREGKLRQCDAGDFTVGVDLAITPGEVVFENELFQLLQYYPLTETQHQRPVFIVPPSINKFYILDMRPETSLVRHLLEQGHPVFLISWRNFSQKQAHITWDDQIEDGIIRALQITREISGERQLNCVGYCVGGTMLSTALAVLAARGDRDIASLSLLATFLDFRNTGQIDVFVDEELVSYRERTIGGQGGPTGLFRGEDMGNTFSMLRPNELWWNYSSEKYLKGEKPAPLDLLFWNNDSTNLPGPMYCWYLRHTYLQNDLKSGDLECCGERMDLRALDMPAYLVGTKEDHIVPWDSAYGSTGILAGKKRFVLGASGHIAGIINPPARKKRQYWTNTELPESHEAWLETAEAHPGSWWTDWFEWLAEHAGPQVPARDKMGTADYPIIEPAPGRYVKE
ncbi:class I poly(R)-hydroxyalkanoic acid synthase [Pseudomonas sp. gcc21]|uniref:class I poly(R)-hydroxyalkanoic acid synthase n=1 Tax=Pseudomonas sp. gcc21 TaxID=2726989 RepID=UPI0014527ED1|nr:class I poly(R)-hydroxyalkanoic acid synthase [Pseudomonas sp. gcc21]QJD58227.1 class I poly(R)-hydroxyalkanoic acid synthase [Pseudomonas sp. gcc21]